MNISVVIPNFNGVQLLEKNIPLLVGTLHSYKEHDMELIIVDDASSDESVNALEKLQKEISYNNITIKIIKQARNKGFSSTVNNGVAHSNNNIVVLLNTDVLPDKNFLDSLIPHFSDKSIFAVGCMDKSVEGEKEVLRGRGLGEWKRGFLIHRRGEVDKSDTLWVSGGSSAVNKQIFDKLGGFDEIYNPFYWEDIDLSYRAQKSGFKILFESKSIVVHQHSKGAIKKHFTPSEIKKIAYRNQIIFVWKNISDMSLLGSHFIWLPYYVVKSIIRLDTEFLLGLFLAMIKIPDIIKKRKKQKRLYTQSDQDIL
jgi:GT2 family glycosyltransferase